MPELLLVRDYNPAQVGKNNEVPQNVQRMNQQCDAILHAMAQTDETPSMEMVNDVNWVVNAEGTPINIAPDVTATVTEVVKSQTADAHIQLIKFKVASDKLSAKALVTYVTKLYADYNSKIQHDILGHQFYFDQKYRNNERQDAMHNPHDDDPRSAKKYLINQAPKHLSFVKYNFKSNKTFDNLFGDETFQAIHKRLRHFMGNKEWYQRKGVPYQLGICLSGTSGTGKTSCIGAIANLTQRHVINVNCADILTHTQLKRLFYEEDIHVYKNEEMRETIKLHIPIENRIYVLEELDAVGNTLYEREEGNTGFNEDPLYDELTLGHWLQIFDDVNQVEGRIMVITTNYPERLDKALMRPGRIDLNIKLGNATRETTAQMYNHFFETNLSQKVKATLPDKCLSPADISNIMQCHIESPKEAIKEIHRRAEEAQEKSKVQETPKEQPKPQQQQVQKPKAPIRPTALPGTIHSLFQ